MCQRSCVMALPRICGSDSSTAMLTSSNETESTTGAG